MLFDVLFILVPVLHSIVLVIYSRITNYDNLSGSKQHTLVASRFQWVRNPGTAQLGPRLGAL